MVHVALEDRPSFGLIRKASESGPSILVPPILKVDSAGIGAVMRGSAPDSFVDVKCISVRAERRSKFNGNVPETRV
jgi:hypothetical protein